MGAAGKVYSGTWLASRVSTAELSGGEHECNVPHRQPTLQSLASDRNRR